MTMGRQFDTNHLPFPMPKRSHALSQSWHTLTFLHWEIHPNALEAHLPLGLEIDLFEGRAFVGTIPFWMKHVRPRWLPSVPFVSSFPEFNVRTYVIKDGKPGVYFLTLDAQSLVTCMYATRAYGLPYRYASCRLKVKPHRYEWSSKRRSDGVSLVGHAEAYGPILTAERGTLEYFLFERYCLYSVHKGKLHRGYTHHNPWEFQEATAHVQSNTLTESYDLGIADVLNPDIIHVSSGVDVHTWTMELVE